MTQGLLDPEDEKEHVNWVLKVAWWAVTAVASILGGSFLWLQWKNYVNAAAFNSIDKAARDAICAQRVLHIVAVRRSI